MNILTSWVKSTPPSAGNSRKRGVIHCFSGDIELAQRYTELGFLISLAGSLTYPTALNLVGVAGELPLGKLLVETDSPFLTPQRYRGQRNEPSYVSLVVDKIAQIRQISAEVVEQTTAQNAVNLFGLPVS